MKSVSKKDIDLLGLHDPTVHACLTAHKKPHSGITWEQCLAAMVSYLVEDKRALSAQLIETRRNAPPAGLIRGLECPMLKQSGNAERITDGANDGAR